ncbi:DEP domain-containing mTOR-interacting protein-like isoform X2 [Paramacrobiotus metropolitanus]|nr:DEP domain-containing mTOR-interacting protein-like isoform X2 [Paramacrobiotus metropolitanus]XP_055353776.1 DEP domain-containing mTOR-interacting protein-like isoform X2 [Paramacrobiotus metropolitanus]
MDAEHLAIDFEILAIGEQLRYRMHLAPNLVRDRRYHLRTYSCCFVANETLDWLIQENEVPSRQAGVFLMNILQQNRVIHHVCDDHLFKDQYLFFRFRQDDNTFPLTQVSRLFFFGQRLYDRLHSEPNSCLRKLQKKDRSCVDVFKGAEFTQWIMRKGEAQNVEAALIACQQLLDSGIIQAVDGDSATFKNSESLYRCAFDFNYRRRLHDLFLLSSVQKEAGLHNIKFIPKATSAFEIYPGFDDHSSKSPVSPTPTGLSDGSTGSAGTSPITSNIPRGNYDTQRHMLKESLLEPQSGYVRKVIQVDSDSVGYGFVLRGASPCYIQTVDPDGPAAAAGVKVGQYLYSVNDVVVFDKSHKDVARVIVESGGKICLVVFTPKESDRNSRLDSPKSRKVPSNN